MAKVEIDPSIDDLIDQLDETPKAASKEKGVYKTKSVLTGKDEARKYIPIAEPDKEALAKFLGLTGVRDQQAWVIKLLKAAKVYSEKKE